MAEMIAGARTFIELPAPRTLGGGVLSVAQVIDTSGHDLMGVQALTDACATVEEWDEFCDLTPTGRKVFDGELDPVVGDPFMIYAGVSCSLQRLDVGEARARARLGYGESRAVDFHIDTQLAADGDVVDLGGPFGVAEAIGVAEAFAATVYGGQPTLLLPRQLVPCGCGSGPLYANLDGTLSTCSGSRVAPLTTPITAPVTSTAGTMYVTGQITLLRGPVNAFSVPQQVFDDGSFAPTRALAERIFVPVFDCLVAKVDVTCDTP